MATSFIVISTDLRRANVKAPAGGYMMDVLEEACTKLKLHAENYLLKHNNKPINLTDPIRAVGLTQGAKLELVVKSKTPTAVTVALRLPPSEAALGFPYNRVSAKVRSDTPLWKLLRHLEEADGAKQKGLNITARGVPRTSHTGSATTGSTTAAVVGSGSGQLYWETPVLKFCGRVLSSLADFRKTLSQVGIDTGSQLIVLEFRTSDMTLQEAMEAVQTQLEKTDVDVAIGQAVVAAPAPAQAPAAPELAPTSSAAEKAAPAESSPETEAPEAPPAPGPAPAAAEPMDVDSASQLVSHLQPVQVWSPPKATAGMPAAASLRWAKEPESVFAPSIAQMKAHQKQLEEAGRNKRLKSDEELEEEAREREAKAAAVDRVDVRIRFPDGHTVMWSFANGATGATLHAAVRGVLHPAVKDDAFLLSPPMSRDVILDRSGSAKDDLVRGYGMRGGIVVNFRRGADVPAPPAGQPYVRPEVAALARDIVIPPTATDEDENEDEEAKPSSSKAGGDTKRPDKNEAVNKMSKFLRLAKK
ncbi:ubx domain protein [Sporothrix brasiliensis 5110]|uniref:Ubx domain protein n=1 Tax=Sporothrix brasiliensis 5110 TaxID=1398154 RepID=A0A0C2FBM7_9PEZI|nr:ubx domain protein [Sporothrix brasiliensis 5110]KIH88488.1 ubx domain protein [Sporothrix brasiliensis 5110]